MHFGELDFEVGEFLIVTFPDDLQLFDLSQAARQLLFHFIVLHFESLVVFFDLQQLLSAVSNVI